MSDNNLTVLAQPGQTVAIQTPATPTSPVPGLFRYILARIGKGEGFFAVAMIQAIGLFVLAYYKPDTNWAGFAVAMAAINAPFFGAGAWKAAAEA